MSSIKRILRETSYKILGKMGASRSGSHSLNGSLSVGDQHMVNHHSNQLAALQQQHQHQQRNKKSSSNSSSKRTQRHHKREAKKNSKQSNKYNSTAAIPEALLIASKNYLPPVQFHHVHGPNVQLHKNKFVARRTQSFCQALVFSNRVILPNERVYIKVLEIAKGWSGTIRFGFTSVDPATLRYQMPKHACPDMTNAGHTWARALADEVIKRNSVIHFSYNTNGFIHYGINNQDCGIFHANVNTNQNLWFIVDIYGLTAAVELIDPRIHNATSDLDISLDDTGDDLALRTPTTMFKSTSAMDQLLSQHMALRAAAKKKRSRKSVSRHAMEQQQQLQHQQQQQLYHRSQHLPEGVILPPGSIGFAAPHQGAAFLPNLSSVMLPSAQQNIYSPMPMINNRPEQHDYYQIMTNQQHSNGRAHNSSLISSPVAADSRLHSTAATTATTTTPLLNSSSISNEAAAAAVSSSNNTGRRGTRRRAANNNDEQAEICQQLSGLQLNQNSDKQQYSSSSQQSSSTTNNKSTTTTAAAAAASTHHPVAAARRRLQSSIEPGKDQSSSSGAKVAKSRQSSANKSSSSSSSNNLKQSTASNSNRDNQQPSPQSKDCPICFERPINCVLYQCGHMCTCYECGVKQWRTQQRTCPICRTIIKDVIKTYMS